MAGRAETLAGSPARGGDGLDSRIAWMRLGRSLALGTIGSVGMWSVVVILPIVQTEFGTLRAGASLPYTLLMIGFAFGGIAMGRLADRFGITVPTVLGAVLLALGYAAASLSTSLMGFALAHALLIGVGSSASFAPLMADISHWFSRHRGIAVSICACGNYLAGAIWPPLVQRAADAYGWRPAMLFIGLGCALAMLPIALSLRRRAPVAVAVSEGEAAQRDGRVPQALAVSPGVLQGALMVAGLACCVAMAMPQVHIVAYCGDLGYGVARGAEMLAVMLGFGVVSRVASGFIADRIGGFATLLAGSILQALSLTLYVFFDGLASLYLISAVFGLVQGGLIPCYAIIVREYFPPREAGARVAMCIMATLFGMALGGWLSGLIFDWSGSYRAAFLNGAAWNLVNVAIVVWLMMSRRDASSVIPGLANARTRNP